MRESALLSEIFTFDAKSSYFELKHFYNQSRKTTGFCANIVVIPCNQWKNSAFLALFPVVLEKLASKNSGLSSSEPLGEIYEETTYKHHCDLIDNSQDIASHYSTAYGINYCSVLESSSFVD